MMITKKYEENLIELGNLMKDAGISKDVASTVVIYLPKNKYKEMIEFVKYNFKIISDFFILMKLLDINEVPIREIKAIAEIYHQKKK